MCTAMTITAIISGTYKVRNEIETKRNETKRNQQKRNETKRNQRNENEMKRNQRKQNEIN
jgi:NADH:ubiquinone oxidoreductase subunit B-like Fe-S oxidoreductase